MKRKYMQTFFLLFLFLILLYFLIKLYSPDKGPEHFNDNVTNDWNSNSSELSINYS